MFQKTMCINVPVDNVSWWQWQVLQNFVGKMKMGTQCPVGSFLLLQTVPVCLQSWCLGPAGKSPWHTWRLLSADVLVRPQTFPDQELCPGRLLWASLLSHRSLEGVFWGARLHQGVLRNSWSLLQSGLPKNDHHTRRTCCSKQMSTVWRCSPQSNLCQWTGLATDLQAGSSSVGPSIPGGLHAVQTLVKIFQWPVVQEWGNVFLWPRENYAVLSIIHR